MLRPRTVTLSSALLLFAFLAMLGVGCDPPTPTEQSESAPVVQNQVKLTVAVADSPKLSAAIKLLQGEWTEHSGGEILVMDCSQDELPKIAEEADLVIYASRYLGQLSEAGLLRRMRESTLKDDQLQFDDYFPLVREQEIVFGRQVMALPLGCPSPLLLRSSEPESGPLRLRIPEENQRLAMTYLAMAAPHALHRSRVATLFDHANMTPHLEEPPFVRALDLFAKSVVNDQGNALVTLPSRDQELPTAADPTDSQGWQVECLPGAAENYNPLSNEWEPLSQTTSYVTLVATSGRVMSVTKSTRNAATAFRFAAWLGRPENAKGLATSSNQTANCRGSMSHSPDPWYEADRDLARQFARRGAEALRRGRYLLVPRILAVDEYLESLGRAIRLRLSGKATSEQALSQANEAWETITERVGRDSQKRAYRRSLGIETLRD